MSQAGLIPYQDDLGHSAELLVSCAAIEKDLKRILGNNVSEMKDLSIAINSSIITLNDCYLDSMNAENTAADAAALVEAYNIACTARQSTAIALPRNSVNEINQIADVFGKDLSDQAREEIRPLDSPDLQPYGRFVRDLLQVRSQDTPQIPAKLIQMWVDDYKRAHNDDDSDDDIQTVGESVERPFCPISGTLLEKPVRATTCGHVFSEESIRHVLHKQIKCPSRGCNHFISRDMLVRDHLMDIRARLWQEKQALTREQETLGLHAV